jgi:large subunit ribosomal protein L9
VSVRAGYARNFLIPRGMAAVANEMQKRLLTEKLRQAERLDQKHKRLAESLAQNYKDVSCTITVQAGDDDKLFGSVTERDIAAALAQQDIAIEHKQIELAEPIKQLGVYSIPVKLHSEVQISVKVWVVKA